MLNQKGLEELDYKVVFPDGLRPHVFVYGIDPETNEIYGAEAWNFVKIKVGYEKKTDNKGNEVIGIGPVSEGDVTINTFRRPPPQTKDLEGQLQQFGKKYGINVIRIQSPKHVGSVVGTHMTSYTLQFEELAKRAKILFLDFMKEYPAYDFYEHVIGAPESFNMTNLLFASTS